MDQKLGADKSWFNDFFLSIVSDQNLDACYNPRKVIVDTSMIGKPALLLKKPAIKIQKWLHSPRMIYSHFREWFHKKDVDVDGKVEIVAEMVLAISERRKNELS